MKTADTLNIKKKKGTLVLGLTGTVSCGKSSALKRFAQNGAFTLSADDLAKARLEKGTAVYRAVVKKFGPAALGRGGEIDKKFLAEKIFTSAVYRRWLESLVHPAALSAASRLIAGKKGIIIFEVPLLFELGLEKSFTAVIAVDISPAARLKLARRRGWTPAELNRRLAAQLPSSAKLEKADFILDNSTTLSALNAQADRLYRALAKIIKEQ